jgi:hypothetical protein
MTLPKQISLFTEDRSTSSQVDFLVNPTQAQEIDLAKKMRDTSGRRCLEQYGRFNRHGLWEKTFSDLLIGTGDWYSTRCRLTWKLKGTKYNRMYFQLYPSTLPTEGTEFGLLPTPNAMDTMETKALRKDNNLMEGGKHGVSLHHLSSHGMLPTPRVKGHGNSHQRIEDGKIDDLTTMARFNMLPTPMASDCGDKVTGLEDQNFLVKMAREATGQTSQLNPRFVLEMMGFPPDWTELPFLSGETNP